MSKIIFGFSGLLSSGKGTVVKYLEEKHGAKGYRFSSMIRYVLDRFYLPHTRENMVLASEALREKFGDDILSKTMAEDVKKDNTELIIVDGVRRLSDIKFLMLLPNFVLVKIETDYKIRYERLIKRGENSDDNSKTYEQFLADHQKSTEITIPEVMEKATETINNDGSLEDLHNQLDTLVAKYK